MKRKMYMHELVDADVDGIFANMRLRGGPCDNDSKDETWPRILKRVYLKEVDGETWLYWEWHPDHRRRYDCGYSGVQLGEVYSLETLYLERLETQ